MNKRKKIITDINKLYLRIGRETYEDAFITPKIEKTKSSKSSEKKTSDLSTEKLPEIAEEIEEKVVKNLDNDFAKAVPSTEISVKTRQICLQEIRKISNSRFI